MTPYHYAFSRAFQYRMKKNEQVELGKKIFEEN